MRCSQTKGIWLLVLALAGCGTNPGAPLEAPHELKISVVWLKAAEPDFEPGMYSLYYVAGEWGDSEAINLAKGMIPANGEFRIQCPMLDCRNAGTPLLSVNGRYSNAFRECYVTIGVECTGYEQTVTILTGDEINPGCTPPGG